MSQADADRNLLAGLLALQLNLVTREQLIDATLEWTRSKTRPLADVMVARGDLRAEEKRTLLGVVELHLARHGNDARQSLASLDAAEAAAALRGATCDVDVHQSLAGCRPALDVHATAPPPGADPFQTAATTEGADADATPPLLGAGRSASAARSLPGATVVESLSQAAARRYEVLRPYQRGGLGQVSIARDLELHREVALKEILPQHADSDEARQRFLLEAEITGALEHPGVAPVYGLGQYADGRPFYAMRFIHGDNLQLAIEQFHGQPDAPHRELRFRQLLGRFVAVCQVIEYAHNRGVLHRDLKPANIMLGKYGETLVVDWGLAKPLGATARAVLPLEEAPLRPESIDVSTATQMGRIVGTPAYMSPEQAAGRLDLVGPAADIYSLGATLYHVLTGSAPLGSEAGHDVLRRVVQGEFPAPRERRPEAPRPLEAICLKAMAREPHARYASAHALAEDVERYLADEPVQAFAEPWPLRAARWMRKHRPLVYGGAAVLVVTAAALTLGVLLLGAANRREQAQRQLAERNFAMARDAVRDYYISVSEETLLDQEGMQPLRDRLLRQALDYYRTFVESEPDEPALRDELAQANFYVGSITEKVDSPAEAMPFYEQALRLYQEAELEGSDAVARREGEGKCLNALGGALQKLHRFDEALTQYERAVGVRRELLALAPGNIDYLRTLANTVMNQGTIWVQRGDEQRGIALWNEAQQLRRAQLQPQNPDHRLLLRDAGLGNFNLGLFELDLDRPAEAEQFLTEAAGAFQRVCELNPNDLDSQYRLAIAYRTLGDLQPLPDGRQRARDYYEKALELLRQLTVRNPEVPSYRAEWGAVQLTVADLLLVTDQSEEALETLDLAVETLSALVVEFPDVPLYARNWGVALRLRGEVRWQRAATDAERAAAAADLQQAAAALERLAAASPADDDFAAQRDAAVEAWTEARRALDAADSTAAGSEPGTTPETQTPETQTPETQTPETQTPETQTPETESTRESAA